MWTLIIVTLISMDPPKYYYNPVMILDSYAKCEEVAASIRKTESGKPIRILCTKSNL